MNCRVPEFFLDDDSVFASPVRSFVDSSPFGEEIVELLWDNGPVFRRTPQDELRSRSGISASCTAAEPFLEDEMVAWLNYPLGDGEDRGAVSSDQAIPVPLDCSRRSPSVAGEGLETPAKTPAAQHRFFRSLESTIEDSSVRSMPTMEALPEHGAHSGFEKGETIFCKQGITASSGVICETEASDPKAPPLDFRKQKAADAEDSDSISESIDKQEDSRRSASKKRPRAAEVHNLSERRRRDRINEKMKALQDLLPRCNKSDKASMLDDAIRYLKFLQSQVQMMSMYCNMFPMMVPGVHNHRHPNQFLPQMGMAMPMGLNMGLGMRPIPPPFFPVLSSPRMGPPIAAHLSPGPQPMADPALARSSHQQNPGFPHENSKQLAGSRGQRPGSTL